jgi:hypothetical protein
MYKFLKPWPDNLTFCKQINWYDFIPYPETALDL